MFSPQPKQDEKMKLIPFYQNNLAYKHWKDTAMEEILSSKKVQEKIIQKQKKIIPINYLNNSEINQEQILKINKVTRIL